MPAKEVVGLISKIHWHKRHLKTIISFWRSVKLLNLNTVAYSQLRAGASGSRDLKEHQCPNKHIQILRNEKGSRDRDYLNLRLSHMFSNYLDRLEYPWPTQILAPFMLALIRPSAASSAIRIPHIRVEDPAHVPEARGPSPSQILQIGNNLALLD